jgi:hypothetical protein
MSRKFNSIFHLFLLILLFSLICPHALAASVDSLTCAIVATNDLELRPLQLNQRDVVSVLDMVYEGLFAMDDNYAPLGKGDLLDLSNYL